MREITYLQARDPTVFIMGEDIRQWGAPLGEFKGLFEKYGGERVRDTAISETAMLGATANKLQERGISVEVVDPRSLAPLDKQTIIGSVKKTGRLVIMDEEPKTESASSEITAIVAEEALDLLDAPIKRVCAPDTPIPFSPVLEKAWMPDEEDLIKAITEIM